ncbi:hydroxypyruvate isomerase family protein [Mycolicibacterium goodii]|uniref:hydroxypyruvate isomerase family protein n=1 Tax=Mycolicibacterium goodii TaxID=134601 RepID=UPI0019526C09
MPFEARFEAAAENGFTAVEYASPYEHTAISLRQLLEANDLQQILINTPAGEPGSPERAGAACLPGAGHIFRDQVHRALDYAAELDCGLVHVMAGIRPPHVSHDRALGTYLDNLGWAAERAVTGGVRLVLEAINHTDRPGHFLETQEMAADIVSALGGDALGVLFDVYHCAVSQGDVVARLRKLQPWVAHVQVADLPHRGEPGTGKVPWESVFDQLRGANYTGWIGCEYRPVADTAGGLSWLSRFGVGQQSSPARR